MSNECIQVVVRMRPFNTKEKTEGRNGIVDMDLALNQVAIKNPDNLEAPPKVFTFDSVYDGNTQQRAFYEESCFGLIESVLEGFNGTIFAYGQTGCGKTWTMQGPNQPPELRGVIPNSFSHIFDHVTASKDGTEYLVRCSYLEIYNEVIRDLLGDQKNPPKCDLKEDPQKGIVVANLTDYVVKNEQDMDSMLLRGLSNRTVGATLMNSESSRSHSIFTIIVEMNNRDANGKDHVRAGKLNLVDLAGSERQKKTGASGDRLKEGSKINLSLSALGNVISALSDGGGKHIPYRDSKLTRLLQDSLGGNTKTLMVAALSPADYNYDETLSTLRYANRAKSIKNKPKINEDPKDAMIREFKEEIERLRKILSAQGISLTDGPLQLSQGQIIQQQQQSHSKNKNDSISSPRYETLDSFEEDSPKKPKNSKSSPTQENSEPNFTSSSSSSSSNNNNNNVIIKPAPPRDLDKALVKNSSVTSVSTIIEELPIIQTSDIITSIDSISPQPSKISSDNQASTKSSPRGTKSSPRSKNVRSPRSSNEVRVEEKVVVEEKIVEKVRVEKEIVEVRVEVEKIPESHLHKQKELEEYSQAIEEERDYIGEQLKEVQNEVELERNKRQDLAKRLQELQEKLMGMTLNLELINEGNTISSPIQAPLSAQKLQEQHDAEMRLNERKAKAKKKEEARKKAENDRLEKDTKDIDGELQQAISSSDETVEKRITKIKKKFEKKLNAARNEIDDLHEEFEMEREEMLENIREANKEAELFKQICLSLLEEKKLQQIIDKCQYDESNSEWILPVIKPLRDSEFRLPEIDSRYGVIDDHSGNNNNNNNNYNNSNNNSRNQSAKARPSSGQNNTTILPRRPNSRTSRDDNNNDINPKDKNLKSNSIEDDNKIPSLNLPSYAPSKPPMPRSARRDKKKSKTSSSSSTSSTTVPSSYDIDEYGTGESAGSTSEWGFVISETLIKDNSNHNNNNNIPKDIHTDSEIDERMILNHIDNGHGDRQSSRHGSRRSKVRSSSGTKRNNGGSVSESSINDKSFNTTCSPRGNERIHLPHL